MGYRINERNIGVHKIDGSPKNGGKKLTQNEMDTVAIVISRVYDAMEQDEVTGAFTDGGRIVISLTGEQMFDLFEAKRKISGSI